MQDSPDLLVVEMNRQIIGYNHVFWRWIEVTGTRVYLHLGYLLPEWRGKGIGSAMLSWAQQRIRELAAQEQPEGQRLLRPTYRVQNEKLMHLSNMQATLPSGD